jgi:hypothetical protein
MNFSVINFNLDRNFVILDFFLKKIKYIYLNQLIHINSRTYKIVYIK